MAAKKFVRALRVLSVITCIALVPVCVATVRADEIWVPPTSQADLGGLEVASNTFWPVTPIGAVRMAWAVPNNLQTFQGAKVVLIPSSPGGAANVNVFVCAAQSGNSAAASCAGPFAQPFTGVANQLVEVEIGPSIASRIGAPGANYLTVLAYTSPTTATDHIVGMRFAYAPTVPAGAATLGANTFTGTQTAPAFVGDGSGLTNLPTPSGVATLGANTFTGTQTAPAFAGDGSAVSNVNANLLDGLDSTAFATAGSTASLGANTFTGTQTINAGNLDLDPSTSTTGLVTKNGVRFLHNVGTNNTFLGLDAGNLTLTGDGNTASGYAALNSNTTGDTNTATGSQALPVNTIGSHNTATGANALRANTTGGNNTATGYNSLFTNTTGHENTATGLQALHINTSGIGNVAIGHQSLGSNTIGHQNVALGFLAGSNATTGSSNIYLGGSVLGVAGESGAIYLGVQGTQTKTVIAGIRGTTVSGGETVFIDAAGRLGSGPVTPGANTIGTNEVINDSLTASDLGPDSVGTSELAADSVTAAKVAFNYAASASEGGAAADVACVGCISASEVNFGFATLGANAFTGTQTIDTGNLDLDASTATTGNITKDGTRFLHDFGVNNTFLGRDAGNLTMTGQNNTASGATALRSNTIGSNNTALGITLVNNTSGSDNTGIGYQALLFNSSGTENTATGTGALTFNTTGSQNTAAGRLALHDNSTGAFNTATGSGSLLRNTNGQYNTALGYGTLPWSTTASSNTAVGAVALGNTTIGIDNTAVGFSALSGNLSGTNNVGVGKHAGAATDTGSNNIYLGAMVLGVAGESNAMYLGKMGTQTKTIIAGVRGAVTGVANAIPVVIDSNGQLGTVSSSVRFKEDIHDMADASRRLLKLRPVTFRYTQAYINGAKPIQYGLIAEEVADVFPELAVRGADGQVETVHYETLNVLLLNELQEQVRLNDAQQLRLDALERQLNALLDAH